MPATRNDCRRPFNSRVTVSPGWRALASAKASPTSTSPRPSGLNPGPRRRNSRFSRGSPVSGRDRTSPLAGSSNPARSSVTCMAMPVSTSATPGRARRRSATPRGARLSVAKTSAKRWVW